MNILGLGESLSNYVDDGRLTIGVNDIYRYQYADIVLTMDKPARFSHERLQVMERCLPDIFYSPHKEWQCHPRFRMLNLMSIRSEIPAHFWMNGYYPHSNNSVFTAVAIGISEAILGKDKTIKVYGFDLANHNQLSDETPYYHAVTDMVRLIEIGRRNDIEIISCSKIQF
jgi:hypothetical protein